MKYQVTQFLEAIERSDTQEIRDDIEGFMLQVANDTSGDVDNEYAFSLIGETIDKYKIMNLIGHGEMRSVFLAERADGAYDRKIAFKVMRRGMDTPL